MSNQILSESAIDALSDVECTLMTLRKPTDLKKVIDSVPRPGGAVPKNGLPIWYKIGLECKLPVPKFPAGKVLFSRGKIGEDVRRRDDDGPQPSFDLTDPYCRSISFDYVVEHDPHLARHFAQKAARRRMKQLGYVTKDGRAVCSLKDFNQYRKYLYNQFMDRIHMEIKKLDERAKDDLTLKRVDRDVDRRRLVFIRTERAREFMEKAALEQAEEWAEKKRLAQEQEMKIQARMENLAEYKELQRRERVLRAQEKESRIKQRVQSAAEMELRRKITMVRTWRLNERKRINRLKQEKEAKERKLEEQANQKWTQRIDSQNQKILKEALLLKLYTEDMSAGATRRAKKAEIRAYNTDLELQRIRLENWKMIHGGKAKEKQLVRKMGVEFEKSKRGAKGMSPELAHRLAVEAMSQAMSTKGDALMTLGQARAKMDKETILPNAVMRIIDEVLEMCINEFTRRRVALLLQHIEQYVREHAAVIFFENIRPAQKKRESKPPRWQAKVVSEMAQHADNMRSSTVVFGDIINIAAESTTDVDLKSVRDRPPTPVPSKSELAEVTFCDRVEDLTDPVSCPADLHERKKILEMLNLSEKFLTRSVISKVQKGMDTTTGTVTLPHMRHTLEWGEAVEGLTSAVVEARVHAESGDVRRASHFLARRILSSLLAEMKEEKRRLKYSLRSTSSENNMDKDFYTPDVNTVGEPHD